jgi:hypothetical protein
MVAVPKANAMGMPPATHADQQHEEHDQVVVAHGQQGRLGHSHRRSRPPRPRRRAAGASSSGRHARDRRQQHQDRADRQGGGAQAIGNFQRRRGDGICSTAWSTAGWITISTKMQTTSAATVSSQMRPSRNAVDDGGEPHVFTAIQGQHGTAWTAR